MTGMNFRELLLLRLEIEALNAEFAYLIDHDHVSVATLDPLNRSPLAKTGDAEKMLLTVEYGLKMENKDAHAVARDLS